MTAPCAHTGWRHRGYECTACGEVRPPWEALGVPDASTDTCRHCEHLRTRLAEVVAGRDEARGKLQALLVGDLHPVTQLNARLSAALEAAKACPGNGCWCWQAAGEPDERHTALCRRVRAAL